MATQITCDLCGALCSKGGVQLYITTNHESRYAGMQIELDLCDDSFEELCTNQAWGISAKTELQRKLLATAAQPQYRQSVNTELSSTCGCNCCEACKKGINTEAQVSTQMPMYSML